MKVKTTKKLQLNRETLIQLEQAELRQVAGGATLRCEYSGYQTCATCGQTCGTNLC
ncbi:MAG TPA: class I lanthipeptide [Thermoanaerobaculia bacterium]|nr:class I lanthipeptide [Thermoanaerobaculia bacterium]